MRRGVFVADYVLTPKRAILGLLSGAALGVVMRILLPFYLGIGQGLFGRGDMPWEVERQHLEWFAGSMAQKAPAVFLTGLVLLIFYGVPIWYCLYKLRLRGWAAMACGGAAGAVLAIAALRIVFGGRMPAFPAMPGAMNMVLLPVFLAGGMAIGVLIWAVAYRRPEASPSAEVFE